MAIDEFANCFANKVSTDVDAVKRLSGEQWKKLADWWDGLRDLDKKFILEIAKYGGGAIAALIGATLGDVIAGAAVAFAGGASWEILFNAAVECEGQL